MKLSCLVYLICIGQVLAQAPDMEVFHTVYAYHPLTQTQLRELEIGQTSAPDGPRSARIIFDTDLSNNDPAKLKQYLADPANENDLWVAAQMDLQKSHAIQMLKEKIAAKYPGYSASVTFKYVLPTNIKCLIKVDADGKKDDSSCQRLMSHQMSYLSFALSPSDKKMPKLNFSIYLNNFEGVDAALARFAPEKTAATYEQQLMPDLFFGEALESRINTALDFHGVSMSESDRQKGQLLDQVVNGSLGDKPRGMQETYATANAEEVDRAVQVIEVPTKASKADKPKKLRIPLVTDDSTATRKASPGKGRNDVPDPFTAND